MLCSNFPESDRLRNSFMVLTFGTFSVTAWAILILILGECFRNPSILCILLLMNWKRPPAKSNKNWKQIAKHATRYTFPCKQITKISIFSAQMFTIVPIYKVYAVRRILFDQKYIYLRFLFVWGKVNQNRKLKWRFILHNFKIFIKTLNMPV